MIICSPHLKLAKRHGRQTTWSQDRTRSGNSRDLGTSGEGLPTLMPHASSPVLPRSGLSVPSFCSVTTGSTIPRSRTTESDGEVISSRGPVPARTRCWCCFRASGARRDRSNVFIFVYSIASAGSSARFSNLAHFKHIYPSTPSLSSRNGGLLRITGSAGRVSQSVALHRFALAASLHHRSNAALPSSLTAISAMSTTRLPSSSLGSDDSVVEDCEVVLSSSVCSWVSSGQLPGISKVVVIVNALVI
jgi:hypothetical protein